MRTHVALLAFSTLLTLLPTAQADEPGCSTVPEIIGCILNDPPPLYSCVGFFPPPGESEIPDVAPVVGWGTYYRSTVRDGDWYGIVIANGGHAEGAAWMHDSFVFFGFIYNGEVCNNKAIGTNMGGWPAHWSWYLSEIIDQDAPQSRGP